MIGLQPNDTIAIAVTAGGSIQCAGSGLNTTTAGVNTPLTFPTLTVAPSGITTFLNPTSTNQFNVTEMSFYNAGTAAVMTVYRQPNGGTQVIAWAGSMAAGDSLQYGPGGWQHYNSAGQVPGSGGGISVTGVPTNEQAIVYSSALSSYVPGFSRSYVTRRYARSTWR